MTFLSQAASPPSFTFLDKSHIAIFLILLSKKYYWVYLKNFGWQYFPILVIKPQIYVEYCLKTEIALFLQKMWKNDGNTLGT